MFDRYAPAVKRSILFFLVITLTIPSAKSIAQEKEFIVDLVRVSTSGPPVDKGELQSVRSGLLQVSIPYWNSELVSKDSSINMKLGLVDSRLIQISTQPVCSGSSLNSYMKELRRIFYGQNSISNVSNRYLIAYFDRMPCIWEAISTLYEVGTIDGGMILNGTSKPFVISHELGHGLGLGHSNLIACNNGKREGAWLSECNSIEYGGVVDLMSNVENYSQLSSYHRWRLGLISKNEAVQVFTDTQTTLFDVREPTGMKSLFVRDQGSSYWFEYRGKSSGGAIKPGLLIYRIDPPPVAAQISPNASSVSRYSENSLPADVWVINLDDYRYLRGDARGSMSLPDKSTFPFFSGNLTLTTSAGSEKSVSVNLDFKDDRNPPPSPKLIPQTEWGSPESSILVQGEQFLDKESQVLRYEYEINGTVLSGGSPDPSWIKNYIYPFDAPIVFSSKLLPEGTYNLKVRAVDAWGNKSFWSEESKVFIDRGYPKISKEVYVSSVESNSRTLTFRGISDAGSGICLIQIANSEGLVVAQSTSKSSLEVREVNTTNVAKELQVFDCSGNGVSADLKMQVTEREISSTKRTGKWTFSGQGRAEKATCVGKCTASFSIGGFVTIGVLKGKGAVLINGKKSKVFDVQGSGKKIQEVFLDLSSKRSTVRIEGSGISISPIQQIDLQLLSVKEGTRRTSSSTFEIDSEIQKDLAKFGFRTNDLTSTWNLQPIPNGYTLVDPTLDFCAESYRSDSERSARRQLQAFRSPDTKYSFISSEVVSYNTEKAADSALSELKETIERCRKQDGFTKKDGTNERYDFSSPPSILELNELNQRGVVVHVKIGSGANIRSLLAFYVFSRNLFSGLYVVKSGDSPFTKDEIDNWSAVNRVLMDRLRGT